MRNITSNLIPIIFVIFVLSGAFQMLLNGMAWLLSLKFLQPQISFTGNIIVNILTYLATFRLVGRIFKSLHSFNSTAMRVVYFIVSTILCFILSYVIYTLETYAVYVALALCGMVVLYLIINAVVNRQPKNTIKE